MSISEKIIAESKSNLLIGCKVIIELNSLSKQNDAVSFDQKNTDQLKELEKIKLHIEKRVGSIDPVELSDTKDNISVLFDEWKRHVEYHKSNLRYREPPSTMISTTQLERYMYLLKTDIESKRQLIPVPISLRNAEQEHNLRYLDLNLKRTLLICLHVLLNCINMIVKMIIKRHGKNGLNQIKIF